MSPVSPFHSSTLTRKDYVEQFSLQLAKSIQGMKKKLFSLFAFTTSSIQLSRL